jgi:hypothetical protein
MFKRIALGLVLVTLALGIVFIALNILDIDEDFRLRLPIAVLNTVLISAVAVLIAYIAAISFTIDGSPELLGLGCAALAFGVGSLLRGWLVGIGLNVPITINDSAALIASVMHLIGASLGMAKLRLTKSKLRQKQSIIVWSYFGILASLALVTLLALRGIIPPFSVSGESTPLLRDVVRGTAAILFLASSFIYLRIYSRSRTDFYYWYSLGLMLFAFGVVFMSQGAIESRIGWLGRASQYVGGLYFLVSALGAYRLVSARRLK